MAAAAEASAPAQPGRRRSSTCSRSTSRISRSRIRTRRARCSRSRQQPQINIQINVNAKPLADNDFEVELKIEGKAEVPDLLLFSFELLYAGVFRIQNVPQENLQPIVMIECPRLLFPFAREMIATAVRNGGFPPLMLDPVDFVVALPPEAWQASSRQRRRPPSVFRCMIFRDRVRRFGITRRPADSPARSPCRRASRRRRGARRARPSVTRGAQRRRAHAHRDRRCCCVAPTEASRPGRAAPAARRSARHRPRPAARRRAARRAWCGARLSIEKRAHRSSSLFGPAG